MKKPILTIAGALGLAAALAHADPVPLASTWSFHDPEGNSSLTNQSATGFDFLRTNYVGNLQDTDNAVAITSIVEDTFFGGIEVTAPGHGRVPGEQVVLDGTSEASYNTGPVAVSDVLDPDTIVLDDIPWTVDATGGTVGPSVGQNTQLFPRVYQVHAPVDMSAIGSIYSCALDFESLDQVIFNAGGGNGRGALRLAFGDSAKNAEFILMIHLGKVTGRDDALKVRLDNNVFAVPGDPIDPSFMGVGGQSWSVEAMFPAGNDNFNNGESNRLGKPGSVHRLSFNLIRVSATEFKLLQKWQIISSDDPASATAGEGTEVYVLRYDETNGNLDGRSGSFGDDWGGLGAAGALDRIDFCGLLFHQHATWDDGDADTVDSGTVRCSNWEVTSHRDFFKDCHQLAITELTGENYRLEWRGFQDVRDTATTVPGQQEDGGSKYFVYARNDDLAGPFTAIFGNLTAGNNPTGGPIGLDRTVFDVSSAGLDSALGVSAQGRRFFRIEPSVRPPAD